MGTDVAFAQKRLSEAVDEQQSNQLRVLRCLMSSILHTEEGQESVLVYGMRLFGAFLHSPVPEVCVAVDFLDDAWKLTACASTRFGNSVQKP